MNLRFFALLLLLSFGIIGRVAAESPLFGLQTVPSVSHSSVQAGADLARDISELAGVGVSPMLGVSTIGAWRYFHTPEALRATLPWFCRPLFWGFGFAVLALCCLKDVFGTAAPPFAKMPFDMAELFESKFSAIVVIVGYIPFLATEMARHFPVPAHASVSHSPHLYYASILPIAVTGFDPRLLCIPLCVLCFLAVWMIGDVINVLVAFCPFGFVDILLKMVKMGALAVVVGSYVINPYFGAAVSLLFIFVSVRFAAWAFRIMVFGTVFAIDTLSPWRARRSATPAEAHCFVARKLEGVPVRTYGRIIRAPNGTVRFVYRPWLILPRRTVRIPAGNLALSRGICFPSLLHSPEPSQGFRRMLLFLPRYRSRVEAIAEHFEITDIRDNVLAKGFKALRAMLAETFNIGKAPDAGLQGVRNA